MKKNIIYNLICRLMLLVGITTVVGCANDADVAPSFEFTASPLSLEFADAGDKNLAIYTSGYWMVESDKTWVTFDIENGKGDCDVTVTVVEGGVDTAIISIYQTDSTGSILTSTQPLEIPVERQSLNLGSLIYNESLDIPGGTSPSSPYPFISIYTEWYTTSETDVDIATKVSYEGSQTSIRRTGIASTGYFNASGLNRVYFATAPAKFIVKTIPVSSSDKMFLSFGVSSTTEVATEQYDYELNEEDFVVEISDDGVNWLAVDYEYTPSSSSLYNWNHCFLHFSLANMEGSNLYLRFTSLVDDVHRLDDMSLYKSNEEDAGVVTLDLANAVEDEAEEPADIPSATGTTIENVNDAIIEKGGNGYEWDAAAGRVTVTRYSFVDLGFTDNIKLTGVVVNDPAGKNFVSNSLIIATEGSTDEYNGISIIGEAASVFTNELQAGDKVEVTLISANTSATNVDGAIRVVPTDSTLDWVYVNKVGTGAYGTVELTASSDEFLKPYQGMYVKVTGVAPAEDVIIGSNSDALNIALRTTAASSVYTYAIKSKNTCLYNITIMETETSAATSLCGIAYKSYDVTTLVPSGEYDLVLSKYSVAPRNYADLGDLYDSEFDMRTITIPELHALGESLANGGEMYVDETMDRVFKAVIISDQVGGNTSWMDTYIATPGSVAEPKNGILIDGTETSSLALYRGEIYEFTLQMGLTKLMKDTYGTVYLYSNQNYATITRTNTGLTEETVPVIITSSQMADYEGQLVTIKDATTSSSGFWGSTSNISIGLTDIDGTFYAYSKNRSSLLNYAYLATTSDITGFPSIMTGTAKICPRDPDDVSGFATIGGGSTGGDTGTTTAISSLVSKISGTTAVAVGTDSSIVIEGIVNSCQSSYDNHPFGYLAIQTEGTSAQNTGMYIKTVNPSNPSGLEIGDKVQVTIASASAEVLVDSYGMNVVQPIGGGVATDNGFTFTEKGTANPTIPTLSADADLSKYQGQVVSFDNMTLTTGEALLDTSAHNIIALTSGSNTVNVFFKKSMSHPDFKEAQCYAGTGSVTGVVYNNSGNGWVIVPRYAADFWDFMYDQSQGVQLPTAGVDADNATKITISQILEYAEDNSVGTTGLALSDTGYYYYEAIMTTDYSNGNMFNQYVGMQDPTATTAGNGIFISTLSTGNTGTKGLKYGYKIKVIIPPIDVKVIEDSYGCVMLQGYENSNSNPYFSVIDNTTTEITSIDITSQITSDNPDYRAYQGMYVTIRNASITGGGDWCDNSSGSNQTIIPVTVGEYETSIFVKGIAAGFKDKTYSTGSGILSGVVTPYYNASKGDGYAHIAPQSTSDVSSFMSW